MKLAHLVRANKALAEYTLAFGTPCISGKDSMFIDGNLKDKEGSTRKISGLPALQFTATSKIEDVRKCVSMDVKTPGDLIYLVGETRDELGASEYYEMLGFVGRNVPQLDKRKALKTYKAVEKAIKRKLLKSCHGCYRGGLSVALAQTAFAGGFGLEVALPKVLDRDDKILYSESPGRFVITVSPESREKLEKAMNGVAFSLLGKVREDKGLIIKGISGNEVINRDINELKKVWQKTFEGF